MPSPFVSIANADALTQIFTASARAPVLLFKHDPFCDISTTAVAQILATQGTVPPEPARHEGAITEPIEGQPLPVSPEHERPAAEPASSRPTEESERHEGSITEPADGQVQRPVPST
jgi:hypothetical protein